MGVPRLALQAARLAVVDPGRVRELRQRAGDVEQLVDPPDRRHPARRCLDHLGPECLQRLGRGGVGTVGAFGGI